MYINRTEFNEAVMPPIILMLTAAIAIVGSNSLVLSPIAARVGASLGAVDAAAVMVASAAYGLATAVSALLLAPRADRIGLGLALRIALGALAVGLLLSAAAPTLFILIAGQALAGLAAGVALPATYGLAAEHAPRGRESETLGRVLTGWTISMVVGVSLAALIADALHWRVIFAAFAVGSAGLALAPISHGQRQRGTSPLTALQVPGIGPALLSCVAYMVAFYGLYAYLGAHLQERLGAGTAVTGLATLAYGIGFGLAAPLDRLIDRYGAARTAPAIFAGLSASYMAISLGSGLVTTTIGLFLLLGIANHLGINLIVGRLTSLAPAQRGAIMGLYSAVTYLSMFAGTLAYRPIFTELGFAVCALVSAVCILPAIATALRQTPSAPPSRA